ncbi:MAG: pilus assembly protein TadG-related protein [Roseiarcus sp.]|jgi:Flp pilus assembly protein TadG
MRKFCKQLTAFCFEVGGVTAVTTALLLPVLVGFIGLGIDTANWYSNHRQMERIAELAATAAAPYLSNTSNTSAIITAIAENDAVLNGLSTSNGDSIAVVVASNRSTVSVTATRQLDLYFSSLFLPTAPVTAATAEAGSSSNPVCILVQAATSSQALSVNSGASLNAPDCEIDVASTSSSAAVFNASLMQVAKVCVAGGSTVNDGSTINNLTNDCTPATDPYISNIPTPTVGSCLVNGNVYGPGTVNLNPGTYCGNYNWNGPGTLNLAPGLYIINGGVNWTLSENWTVNGAGVTFYFVNSGSYIDFNGGATVNLTAPTTGTYANILMFEPPGLSSSQSGCTGDGCFNLTAQTTGNELQGVIDLPSRNIYLQASGFTSSGLTLVANTVTLYGTMSGSMSPGASTISSSGGKTGVLLQ